MTKHAPTWANRITGHADVAPDQLLANPDNWRKHPTFQRKALAGVLREVGLVQSVIVNQRTGRLVDGHLRVELAMEQGQATVPVVYVDLSEADERKILATIDPVAALAETDGQALAAILANVTTEDDGLQALLDQMAGILGLPDEAAPGDDGAGAGSLAAKFMLPPFSVLNAREGWWQDRKRGWLALGIKSELGRDAPSYSGQAGLNQIKNGKKPSVAPGGSNMVAGYKNGERSVGLVSESGTSIFDPVLCEIAYRWFCPAGGLVLDPFAGGSVRGIVAAKLGLQYIGHELRAEQVAANRVQAQELCGSDAVQPAWVEGDSRLIDKTCAGVQADLLFTCPPYADLEVYSDDPNDLSTLGYAEFRLAYAEIIAKACGLLKENTFAVCVVGEVRDKRGNYYNFVGDTIQAFRDAGLHYYNEAILITAVGSLPIRAGKQFSASRKLGKTHQNVLVFVKGDGKQAALSCGTVEVDESLFPADESA